MGQSGRHWQQDCPFLPFLPFPLFLPPRASTLRSRAGNLAGRQWDIDVLF